MVLNISEKKLLETTTCYSTFREIWIEVALVVAALGLVIFGTTAYFEIGALSGIPHTSYFAYGAWVGAFLFAGGALVKYLFKRCLSNTPDENLAQQNQTLRNPILSRISHTFSGNSHTLSPDLHRQDSEAVLTQARPRYPDDESQVTERRFASKKCEKYGLGPILPYSGKSNELEPVVTQEDQLQAEAKDSMRGRTEQKSHFKWDYIQYCLEHELQHTDSGNNYIGPDDAKLSNLFLQCQDPEIRFISRQENRACSAFNITDQSNMELLTKKLQAAFLDGKKMAFAILNTGGHAIAAGFSSDGSFIIVDSLRGHRVDPKKIEQMLHEAQKDHTQKKLHFNGRFVNTHIQKGGHECLRFATLYCYHMAVRKDLTAFKEVNGAFLEGRLRRFEDYNKITGSKPIQSLKNKTCNYRTFMLSWLYRSFGLTVDAWWQLTLNELSNMQGQFDAEMMSCYLNKSCLPKFYSSSDFNLEIVSSALKRKKITAQTVDTLNLFVNLDLHAPIEDVFKDNQSYLLVFIKNDPQPRLYSLETGAKVEYSQQVREV